MSAASVMWFRRDLRLADNPALLEACAVDGVLPLFVLDPALWGPAGPSRRAYLAASLRALDGALRQRHAGLSVVRGDPVRQVLRAAREVGAAEVHVAADYG
ncbi:MAG: deoxyribodipyrimidine photo-lyase, partial [Nocardioidaceae bacterium]